MRRASVQQGPGAGTVLVESVASPSPWSAVRSKRVTILSRRRSSFLDLETTAAALAESEFKLVRTMEALDVLEKAHEALQEKHDKLIGHVTAIKADAVNTVWVYCPSKCHDFEHLPRVNPLLVESPDRAGEYELKHVVGKGQFSTVLAGLWAFGHGGPDGFSFGGGGTVAPPNTQSEANVELSAEEVKTAARLRPVTHPRKGVKVAIKVVAKGNVTSIEGAQRVVRELHALHLLKGSPNVVRHYETLHGPTNVYIVNELLPFDLFDFMGHYKEKITAEVVAVVLRELLEALQFLQSKRVAHRDLKPENVLLEVTRNEIVVKLCDFNLCALLPENSSALGTFVGSPGFFAPEALLTPSFCAFKADVFSFGCIALELLTSSKFFSELWIAAYSCLQTVEAPLFSQTIRRATQTAHSEVVRLHCKTNACIGDVVIHALALQPALRASAAALRANVWICKASKFAAADLLNGRQQRKFIDVPSTLTLLVAAPSVSGQLERAPTSPSAAAVAAVTAAATATATAAAAAAAAATGALNNTSLPSPAVPGASRKKSTQFALSAAEPDTQVRSPATTIKLPSSVLSLAASNITQRSRRRLTVTGNGVAAEECCARGGAAVSAVVTPPPLARRGTLLV